jgi:D-amino-acid dehydrogenase
MRVIVLGSGVIGTSAAYYLAEAGHQVVVVDRREGPALETSFANAGEVSPGYSSPWAAPGIPLKALKWLFMHHRPLFIWPTPYPAKVRWGLMMLRNCTSARYELNKSRMVPIATYSRDLLRELRARAGIEYDERSRGTLQLFRSQKMLEGTAKDTAILERLGVPYELLDVAGCIRVEPALRHVRQKIAGGLRLPEDETGDCFKFTGALAAFCRQLGVEFRFGTLIEGLLTEGGRISGVATRTGIVTGDAYVVALGSYSPLLLRRIGIDLPVYPVKGYSITVNLLTPQAQKAAPEVSILDEAAKIVTSRLGDERLRVAGTAEFNGFNRDIRHDRVQPLIDWTREQFPLVDTDRVVAWSGLRPMLPNMLPKVGRGRRPGVFYNTGHGHLGWTLSGATAELLAEAVAAEHAPEAVGLDLAA